MTPQPIAPDSELARAYRAARRYHAESGGQPGHNSHRRPATLAVAKARANLATVAEARAAYAKATRTREAADNAASLRPGGQGPYLQTLTTAEQKARSAQADAMARAGLFHSGPDSWRVWPAVGWARDRTAIHCTHPHGLGAVRDVTKADAIRASLPRGYYDNPHGESCQDGSGLIWGVVAALSHGRYLAGWQAGGFDGGPTLSTRIFGGPGHDPEAAQIDAALYADGMAERVAEAERDRAEAGEAGASWAEGAERLAELRAEIRGWIAEARTVAGLARVAVCEGLRRRLAERAEIMAERAELAESFDHRDGWAEGADL